MAASVCVMTASVSRAADPQFTKLQPVLKKHCVACHGPDKQKSKIRLDTLDPDMVKGKDAETWQLVLDQLNLGEMPPKKKPQPTVAERRALVTWLTGSLRTAAEFKRKDANVVMRRLTKRQYTHTLRDLLGVDVDFGHELPAEGLSDEGFKNNGQDQVISLLQTEYYLKIADQALGKAIAMGKPPVSYRYRYTFGSGVGKGKNPKDHKKKGMHEIPLSKNDYRVETTENRRADLDLNRFTPNDFRNRCYADFRGSRKFKNRFSIEKKGVRLKPAIPHVEKGSNIWLAPAPSLILQIKDFPTEGPFVLRMEVAKADPSKRDAYIKAFIGERLDHGHDFKTFASSARVTGANGRFQTIEFRGRLENFPVPVFDPRSKDKNTMLILGLWNDCMATSTRDKDAGPDVVVRSIELVAPRTERWPPRSHERLFASTGRTESTRSRQIIERFMTRAFRRPVSAAEVGTYHRHWTTVRQGGLSFEQSIRQTLAAVLCSPHFLYLVETPPAAGTETISQVQLASRLSYFLWDSMPDEPLVKLARSNQLKSNLPAQVERMIRDPRSRGFARQRCRSCSSRQL